MRILLRILFIVILISAGISLLRGALNALMTSRSKTKVRGSTVGRLVKDPVCGMYIPAESAVIDGEHSFCSEECRRKFLKAG